MKSIWINGTYYNPDRYAGKEAEISGIGEFEKNILEFINDWHSGKDQFELRTSGSTGTPKKVMLHRKQMVASAEMTLDFLGIRKRGKTLLCLHPGYVAGMMVIVRAMIGDLDIFAVSPTANPFNQKKLEYDFDLTSIVPYQLHSVIAQPESCLNLQKVRNVLIGGAPISAHLIRSVGKFKNKLFQTFGMTETVSHIALRKLTPAPTSSTYRILKGIQVGTDNRNCLTVKGKVTGGKKIITNDVVELMDGRDFIWKGRIDQMINSGGIKISIPELEEKIKETLNTAGSPKELFISGQPDTKLGEKVVLVLEADPEADDELNIKNLLKTKLSRFEVPKAYYFIPKFPRTPTGKIDQHAILKVLGLRN